MYSIKHSVAFFPKCIIIFMQPNLTNVPELNHSLSGPVSDPEDVIQKTLENFYFRSKLQEENFYSIL